MNMGTAIYHIKKPGGILPKESCRKSKYSDEYKKAAIDLIDKLGSRNKAAKQLGISASMLSTFIEQQSSGRF